MNKALTRTWQRWKDRICFWCDARIVETRTGQTITFQCRCKHPLIITCDHWPQDYDNAQKRLFERHNEWT